MELSPKSITNINNDDKSTSSNLLEENEKPPPQKKFYNTQFAIKMRNRKLIQKLRNLAAEEVLTACKSVSVNVIRLSSDSVPKVINTVDQKIRKKKRFQWKLGKTKIKKKPRDDAGGKNKVNKAP